MTDDRPGMVTVPAVTRTVIERLAPAELSVLETYLTAYEADPGLVRHLKPRSGDDATGFGGVDASLTPYVVALASSALTFVAAQAGEAARAAAGERIRRVVDWAFRRGVDPVVPELPAASVAALTSDQLDEVRAVVYRKAREFRLAESTSKNLADAVVGTLVTSVE
ncbi:hypothetical protein ACQP00_22700 [Dactylosporangium sp. CS-047395]|uniref:hypothetical protein n=1 Tax=Dactylosporangium sp. CS-047395 TaxID=3239936 RepID=UPI003D919E4D